MDSLPANLKEAVDELAKDEVIAAALGDHILNQFVAAKREEWGEYIAQVTEWEIGTYLPTY